MKLFAIEEGQLLALEQASRQLHSENRLSGDAMRNLGHTLADVVRVCRQVEIPESAAEPLCPCGKPVHTGPTLPIFAGNGCCLDCNNAALERMMNL